MTRRNKPAHLRVASDDDAPRRPLTLEEAWETGDPREVYAAQGRDIIRRLPEASGAPVAAFHKSLENLMEKISEIDSRKSGALGARRPSEADGDVAYDASAI